MMFKQTRYICLSLIIFTSFSFFIKKVYSQEPEPGKQVAVSKGIIGDVIDTYWLYLPQNYDKNKKWPIILFLQGGHGISNDSTTSKNAGPAKYALLKNENSPLDEYTKNTFIIINPHMREGSYWERQWYQQYNAINSILDYIVAKYSGDSTRIYITGLSRGGNGTWGLAQVLNNRVAAIVPICGINHGVTDFSKIRNIPFWTVHSTGDSTHKYEETLNAVNIIESLCGEKVLRLSSTSLSNKKYLNRKRIFSTIESDDHNVWDMTYNKPEIYMWLLQFNKS